MEENKVTEVPAAAAVVPAAVTLVPVAQAKPRSKAPMIILVALLILFLCCVCSLVGGYLLLRNGDITLNGQCYKGLDNVFANKPVPCAPDANNSGNTNPQAGRPNTGTTVNPDSVNPSSTAPTEPGIYTGAQFSFHYPVGWTVDASSGDSVVLTTPEGDNITFNNSVEETGALTDSTCSDFADSSLSTFQSSINADASLVNSELGSAGQYDACVFDIDTPISSGTDHLRFVYIVNDGKGYLVRLDASDDSTLMSQMLDTVDTIQLK